MVTPVPFRRMLTLAFLLVTAFCGLGYRLVDLQVLRHDELRELAQDNTRRRIFFEPRRGDIRDVRGNLLATSVFVKTLCADPALIAPHAPQVAHAIAPILKLNEAELAQRLAPRIRTNEDGTLSTNRYVVIKRKVLVEEYNSIKQAMTNLDLGVNEQALTKAERGFYYNLRTKSVFADPVDDQLRIYPNETLAAHVLGFVGMGEREINGERVIETTGVEGIERTLNAKLSGVRGWMETETDRRRHEVVAFRQQEVEARDGLNVVLTIDSGVQHIVETELVEAMKKHSPNSVSAIVIRPKTGEILAMATLPTFNPNNPGDAPAAARRNRVICDIAEPGSTFKIVVVSGALNEGITSLADRFNCENGAFHYAGKTLHDHERYGMLTTEEIITKSSNIGAAKIGLKMGEETLYHYISSYGFGNRTGIPLPGEVGGIVHPLNKWSKLSNAWIPMGHETACTPLQMVMAMCTVANGGKLMRPMLVDRMVDQDGHIVAKYQPQIIRQVITPEAAKKMVTALKTVPTKNGTAVNAKLDYYTVAGKTGTAQKSDGHHYMAGKYFSSFIGFFPADDPEICISVVMDEPKNGHYGGTTAAPVFHDIAERTASYLNIRPEIMPQEQQLFTQNQRTGPTTAQRN